MALSQLVKQTRTPVSYNKCIITAPLNVQGGEVYVFKPISADKEGKLQPLTGEVLQYKSAALDDARVDIVSGTVVTTIPF